jgi:Xaa-Pro aminopeptidase
MKSDMDRLMQEKGIDALWITGAADHNPNLVYYTGLHHISGAELIKPRGKQGFLFHNPMERDEAARTGLVTGSEEFSSYSNYLVQADGDVLQAHSLMYQDMLKKAGITSGRVAVTGLKDAGLAYSAFSALQKELPAIEFVGQYQDNVFNLARLTKDADELERIRNVGALTVEVVALTAEHLAGMRAKDGILVNAEKQPVTIGEIKRKIHLWLAERNLESPEELIFSIGRDAGVPHSAGNPEDFIRTGVPIVFDIFPCEAGGGFFYDLTRTWCLGYAPDGVMKLYEDVRQVHETIISELTLGKPFTFYQERTCQLFSAQGHPTIQSDPSLVEGYVHSIGHGVGLAVHEKPFSGIDASKLDVLQPGVVITIEPGLYYPSRAMGIRLEDTLCATPRGEFIVMADYPLDLVIPIRK